MFHMDIGEHFHMGVEPLPIHQDFTSFAGDDPLIRDHRSDPNVDPNERSSGGGRNRHGRAGVVAQDIDAEGCRWTRTFDGVDDVRHGGDGPRVYVVALERGVSKVFDEDGIHTPLDKMGGIFQSSLTHKRKPLGRLRAPWKREQVDHAHKEGR